ncbi:hypothetical protein LDZ95_15520, partial [Pseudomonas aeruginosa]|nr:hypothetical protein [Pseudomonas aeruginosa]
LIERLIEANLAEDHGKTAQR